MSVIIGKIVFAVASTELITCIASRKLVFQRESYAKLVSSFERAKIRRDKTLVSLAAKREAGEKNKSHQRAQKTRDKDAKKLQRDEQELSALAAEVARRHTMAAFYSSLAFLILYRILAAEYAGQVVAVLPFDFPLLRRITFRGLSDLPVAKVHARWMQFTDNESGPSFPGVTHAGQGCSFAFIYILCSLSVKIMVNMAFGTKPPPGADNGVGTLIEAPQSLALMKSFGLDTDDVKEAKKAVGL